MKTSEFRKQLESQGVRVEQGAKHAKLYYKGKQTTLPRHEGKEIGKGLQHKILKQLGIK
ncbi:MAG: type II toxin-antitoxin system HicA family toxin [Comamonadaceae bacterium]|nr:type II toxin-antitoxin system HicA family toxin [Comamonadaceae bacterium]